MNLNLTYNLVRGCAQNRSQLPHFVSLLPSLFYFCQLLVKTRDTAQFVHLLQIWSARMCAQKIMNGG